MEQTNTHKFRLGVVLYIPNTALHKDYEITDEVFKKYVKRMPNNKAPGPDLIVPFWIEKLTSLHSHI